MTGKEIYEFIEPHLGSIKVNTNQVNSNLKNLEKYQELINLLIEDVYRTLKQANDRKEESAMVFKRNCFDILKVLKEDIEKEIDNLNKKKAIDKNEIIDYKKAFDWDFNLIEKYGGRDIDYTKHVVRSIRINVDNLINDLLEVEE